MEVPCVIRMFLDCRSLFYPSKSFFNQSVQFSMCHANLWRKCTDFFESLSGNNVQFYLRLDIWMVWMFILRIFGCKNWFCYNLVLNRLKSNTRQRQKFPLFFRSLKFPALFLCRFTNKFWIRKLSILNICNFLANSS